MLVLVLIWLLLLHLELLHLGLGLWWLPRARRCHSLPKQLCRLP